MKHLVAGTVALLNSITVNAEQVGVVSATSPAHRTALLELYTSEGCSSCPPADRFLTGLKQENISREQLIPLAFHVTYWDYIGWQDRFGNKRYDQRQRRQARLAGSSGVYTPQLMMNGEDYRRYRSFYADIGRINAQAAEYKLELIATIDADTVSVKLDTTQQQPPSTNAAVAYIALYEHDLESQVDDGENKGAHLHHDYVVRELKGPYQIAGQQATFKTEFAIKNYKINNSGIVAFVQPGNKPDVLQAVSLELMQKMFANQ
jgi:hypothetical protein